MLLIKESYHTSDNRGALYHIDEEYDEDGESIGLVANFMGNVVCPDLDSYLAENPDVQVANSLPEGVSIK